MKECCQEPRGFVGGVCDHCGGTVQPEPKAPDYTKMIDCAAIKTPDGKVWTGKRHFHVIATIIQATGAKPPQGSIQGFVTAHRTGHPAQGQFVDRETAKRLCKETGQVTEFCSDSDDLFSEDLY